MTILLIAASALAACTVAYAAGWTRGFVKGREQGVNWAPKSVDVAPAPEERHGKR